MVNMTVGTEVNCCGRLVIVMSQFSIIDFFLEIKFFTSVNVTAFQLYGTASRLVSSCTVQLQGYYPAVLNCFKFSIQLYGKASRMVSSSRVQL